MKRNKNIVPLSHDHHDGLQFIWKINQGLRKDIELNRIADYIKTFWTNSLHAHFLIEEELFSHLQDEMVIRMINEHRDMEKLIDKIALNSTLLDIEEFNRQLENHIRFEERELFPYLENLLNESELEEIGEKINQREPHNKDEYPDEFWK